MEQMELESLLSLIKKDLQRVEDELEERSYLIESKLISRVYRHTFKAGGKRLRPALLLLSAKVGGKSSGEAIRLASMTEIIHLASLIHDDVVDSSSLRRGNPSANSIWGNRTSVLSGDYLLSLVFSRLTQEKRIDVLPVLKLLSSAVKQMCEGEIIQINANQEQMSESLYLKMIKKKTASLFSACCEIGAKLGGAESSVIESLDKYGLNLGVAFQLTDDLLDLTSTKKTLGKPAGSDLDTGKATLPLLRALKVCDYDSKVKLKGLLKKRGKENIKQIVSLLEEHNALDYTRYKAWVYSRRAKESLKVLPESRAKRALSLLSDYVREREY